MKYIDADKLKKEIYIIWENEAINHDVEFLFCDKLSTGKRICELLGVI